jgi:hypothetical protein
MLSDINVVLCYVLSQYRETIVRKVVVHSPARRAEHSRCISFLLCGSCQREMYFSNRRQRPIGRVRDLNYHYLAVFVYLLIEA